jgi:hypothetical protein
MTTWWIVFERRKGSKTWTPTINGGYVVDCVCLASEASAKREVAERESWDGYSEKWEHRIVKVDVPH